VIEFVVVSVKLRPANISGSIDTVIKTVPNRPAVADISCALINASAAYSD
jgi:hypothetical protein